MFKNFKKMRGDEKGFSLLELSIGVSIILLLAAVTGAFTYQSYRDYVKQNAVDTATRYGYDGAAEAIMDFDDSTTIEAALAEAEVSAGVDNQVVLEVIPPESGGMPVHQNELCIKGTWFDNPKFSTVIGPCGDYDPEDPNNNFDPVVTEPEVVARTVLEYTCDSSITGTLPLVGASSATVNLLNVDERTVEKLAYDNSVNGYRATLQGGVNYSLIVEGSFSKLSAQFGTSDIRRDFNNCLTEIKDVPEESGINEISHMGGTKLTDVPNEIPSTVRSLKYAFEGATNFNDSDVNLWNVSNINDFSYMFRNNDSFTQDLNRWEFSTSNSLDINVRAMFADTDNFNGNISDWNTSRFKNMNAIFLNAKNFNQDLSNWDTSNATTLSLAFYGASSFNNGEAPGAFNNPLTWNTANATSMDRTFYGSSAFNQSIHNWNTSKVTTMSQMFNNALRFNQPIDTHTDANGVRLWDTSQVTSMDRMFASASAFNQPLDNWNLSKVKTVSKMFSNATSFNNGDPAGTDPDWTNGIHSWNLTSATDLSSMFNNASSFNQNILRWTFNRSEPVTMRGMFANATSFNSGSGSGVSNNQLNWNGQTIAVTDMSYMFYNASNFNQTVRTFYLNNTKDMSGMFKNAVRFNQTTFTDSYNRWNTSNVENMSEMFSGATRFNRDVSTWDVSNVKNMRMMFKNASTFNNANVSLAAWNNRLGNVENMAYMFRGASAFNQDLSTWQVPKVSVRAGFYANTAKSPTWAIPEASDPGEDVENPVPTE